MRIAFVHDWEPDLHQEMTWKDGLAAAVRILSQRHQLSFFTLGAQDMVLPHPYFPIGVCRNSEKLKNEVMLFDPDIILMWGDCTRPNAENMATLGKPMALCFAGGDPMGPTNRFFDHFFVESAVYAERFEVAGCSVSTAFGTNTELFAPLAGMRKQFDTIFPATFCEWKRHYLYREATQGLQNVCAGFMYPDHERDCWEDTMKAGILTLPHVSAETLRFLYASSKVCVIPSKASGGSQRTVLEAMSMNIPVVVTEDGKGAEYVRDSVNKGMCAGLLSPPDVDALRLAVTEALYDEDTKHGREYVLSRWSEVHYADALESGMLALLNKP